MSFHFPKFLPNFSLQCFSSEMKYFKIQGTVYNHSDCPGPDKANKQNSSYLRQHSLPINSSRIQTAFPCSICSANFHLLQESS